MGWTGGLGAGVVGRRMCVWGHNLHPLAALRNHCSDAPSQGSAAGVLRGHALGADGSGVMGVQRLVVSLGLWEDPPKCITNT